MPHIPYELYGHPQKGGVTSPSVGRCIYCREFNSKDLTREHIIPYSLGGAFILGDASCPDHCKITSRFEEKFTRDMFGTYRAKHGLPSRKSKKQRSHESIFVDCGTHEEEQVVPLNDYPDVLMFPIFDNLPGILFHVPKGPATASRTLVLSNRQEVSRIAAQHKPGRVHIKRKNSTDAFVRMVAKIAHGFAYRDYGSNLSPLLLDIIEGKSINEAGYFIGGPASLMPGPETKHLHEVSSMVCFDGIEGHPYFLVVEVGLFSRHGAPQYVAVAGMLPVEIGKPIVGK